MVYAALGAICFTLVSLVLVLGGEAGRVEMEFRQLGRWGGALDNCSFLFRAFRSSWHPCCLLFTPCCVTRLLSPSASWMDSSALGHSADQGPGHSCLISLQFLAYDTQLVLGNRKHTISPEDYITGALQIYTDIVYIFTFVLQLVGSRD